MTIDELVDAAADLPPVAVAALGACAGFLVVLALAAQLSARRLRRELERAEEELVDPATGLLPRSALGIRLGTDLAWAATSGVPVSVAVLHIRGPRFEQAARVLRDAMREEEQAFLLGDQRVVVELWGVGAEAASAATWRLGSALARAGHVVVDAGIAVAGRDGDDVDTLVRLARRDLRPADDPRQPGVDPATRAGIAGRTAHTLRVLAGIAPGLAASLLLVLVTWRVLPAAIEPVVDGSPDQQMRLLAALGVPLAAGFVTASTWNLGGGPAPRSRPLARAGWRTIGAVTVLVGAPLAWGVLAPGQPPELTDGFGAGLAVTALLVLALLGARQLVHVPLLVLAALVAAGAGLTWHYVEVDPHPVFAAGARIVAAAALGALLARFIERASWLVGLSLLAGAVDAWSVWADSGVTSRLLEPSTGHDRIVDLLLVTGPQVDGVPLLSLGTTDFVFLALYLAWSHDWRLDLRVVCGLLVAAVWGVQLAAELLDEAVPVLPALALAMVTLVAARSGVIRRTAQVPAAASR